MSRIDFNLRKGEQTTLKRGDKVSTFHYNVPQTHDQSKLYKDIVKFANRKSKGMSNVNELKNMNVSLAVEFAGGWVSCDFRKAGSKLAIGLAQYDDDRLGEIVSFKLMMVTNIE